MPIVCDTEERKLTPREAAVLHGVTLNYLYSLLWLGRLPGAYQVMGRWVIPASSVLALRKTA